jgi:hypothetical protein
LGCPFILWEFGTHHHDVVGLACPQLTIFQFRLKQLAFILSSSFNIEILVALPDGEGGGPWEEFMAEDFCDEDVLGHVFGFEAVAADSGVGASQVAWFPGLVDGAEGSRNVFGELRAGGRVDGIGGRKAL